MDGVLDSESDILLRMDPHRDAAAAPIACSERRRKQLRIAPRFDRPLVWYKNNISCFRLSEFKSHYEDEGWTVSPLLIIRDVRETWASLLGKSYGVNGFVAEDPPLRMRFRRFKEDWELFRAKGWPILRFESFLRDHEGTLRETCRALALPWDDSMMKWTKQTDQIADVSNGNDSFWQTLGPNLAETLARYAAKKRKPIVIGGGDLVWLENEFSAFNAANDYPAHAACAEVNDQSAAPICGFEELRRYEWQIRRKPIRWLLNRLSSLKKAG
jgi:hypothetical protein